METRSFLDRRVAGAGWPVGLVPVLAVAGVLAGASRAAASSTACPNAAPTASISCTYESTGAEQTYVVPAGVTELRVVAVGAPGEGLNGASGGSGASIAATVPVTPGATLYVEVGVAGHDHGFGGFGGGGNGGGTGDGIGGAGGGGASDVRTCSMLDSSCVLTGVPASDPRLVVAAGGGGAGELDEQDIGGDPAGQGPAQGPSEEGGSAGDAGVTGAGDGGDYRSSGDPGGFGGTGGGAGGGNGGSDACSVGFAGAAGVGGSVEQDCEDHGGGGGGGFWGGGGGGDGSEPVDAGEDWLLGGGGGAGSSYWTSSATVTSISTDTTGTPTVVITPAPANTALPRITGTFAYGQKLTASGGAWQADSALTHAYQWESCTSAAVSSCSAIAGAVHSTLTAGDAELGRYVAVRVTVTDQNAGTTSATSAVLGPPLAAPAPVPTTSPSLTGRLQDGATLTAHRSAWSDPAPMTYRYAWYACADAGSQHCVAIDGQSAYTLRLTSAEVGKWIEVVMTADASGTPASNSVESGTAVAKPAAPVKIAAPTITGPANVGAVAVTTTGTWRSPDELAYHYQWLRCTTSASSSCTTISAATQQHHTRSAADNGKKLGVRVTATDAEGQSTSATVVQT